jgi:DNA-binding NtrC family response regulator
MPLQLPITKDRFLHYVKATVTPDDGAVGMSFSARSPLPELHFGVFVGESAAMHRVYRTLEKVARAETTCLVTGESGTGKELAAAVIHQSSSRNDKRFVAVNCGAIPENLLESEFFGHKKGAFTGAVSDHKGRFEMAHKGTLFLDEIGEMQLSLQVKLLRALQDREVTPVGSSQPRAVDVRVVAATNRDLVAEMGEGNFREDLYYRLAVIPVRLPALRERREDIPLLVRFLVERINQRSIIKVSGITRRALDALVGWDWPGNVRELSAALERMVVMADNDTLSVEDLPAPIRAAAGLVEPVCDELDAVSPYAEPLLPEEGLHLNEAVLAYENSLMLQALNRTGWNKNRAAQLLQMNRTTLVEKLKKRGLAEPTS